MSIPIIEYNGEVYPAFQASGNAARFIIPFAQEVCKGHGLDIGCGKVEWAFPGAFPIDRTIEIERYRYDALDLPVALDLIGSEKWDYIFSSHCLEHLDDWVQALNYWTDNLRIGGTLFLYLPHYDQQYWRPWHNRKHVNIFTPQIITDYMKDNGYVNIFHSERDLNHSFAVFGEKMPFPKYEA